jgi:hypothetical protein
MPHCIEVWRELSLNGDGTKIQNEAKGFIRTWSEKTIWLTALMADMLEIFQSLQQQLQRATLILPEVLTCKAMAIRKLELIQQQPYPGKQEYKHPRPAPPTEESDAHPRERFNSFVTTGHRDAEAIRNEVIIAAKNFFEQRLDDEQQGMVIDIGKLLKSNTIDTFIASGRPLVEQLFPNELGQFCDEVCERWEELSAVPHLPEGSDLGACMSARLRQMIPISHGTSCLRKLLGAIVTLSPHSMQVERIVSHYNLTADDRRQSFNEVTLNIHLLVALNGCGTAHYDPRNAVTTFLQRRQRRYQEPTPETYSRREFAQKFFRAGGNL